LSTLVSRDDRINLVVVDLPLQIIEINLGRVRPQQDGISGNRFDALSADLLGKRVFDIRSHHRVCTHPNHQDSVELPP
jgi:hypothetical protein